MFGFFSAILFLVCENRVLVAGKDSLTEQLYVVGDIHGAAKALDQVLERSNFRPDVDRLVVLGDVCDGWPETKEVIDQLTDLAHVVPLLGNHDEWAKQFFLKEVNAVNPADMGFVAWKSQGGMSTIESLGESPDAKYLDYFSSCLWYHQENDIIFAHGNVPDRLDLDSSFSFLWRRDLIRSAYEYRGTSSAVQLKQWKEIYLGHTPVQRFDSNLRTPQQWGNVWAMDTDAARMGCVSLMNVGTKELIQSDPCFRLYPDHRGRN